MKIILILFLLCIFSSCGERRKQLDDNNSKGIPIEKSDMLNKKIAKSDTLKYIAPKEGIVYMLDTLLIGIHYKIKTYCLNDSAVIIRVNSNSADTNKHIIELGVHHNYATEIEILKQNKSEAIKVKIVKETFRDSLPQDFLNTCSMWYNQYEKVIKGNVIFHAKIGEPDTDYQFGVYYSIVDDGKIKILKIEDESFNGSGEDEQ